MRSPLIYIVSAVAALAVAAALYLLGPRTVQGGGGSPGEMVRTVDGKPDFSGIWQANSSAHWDLLSHDARPIVGQPGAYPDVPVLAAPVVALGTIGWIPADLGVVEGDEIPYQPWAAARQQENFADVLDRDPEVRCYLPGVPRAMYMPHKFQIIQGTTKVMMAFEFRNADRTIHLDEVALYPADAYMGHSVGRWEGDTLVVDVTRFTPYTWLDRSGNFHSDALHVVERYHASRSRRDSIRGDDRGPEGLHETLDDSPSAVPAARTGRAPRPVPVHGNGGGDGARASPTDAARGALGGEDDDPGRDAQGAGGGGGSLPTPDFRQSARVGRRSALTWTLRP